MPFPRGKEQRKVDQKHVVVAASQLAVFAEETFLPIIWCPLHENLGGEIFLGTRKMLSP